MWIWVSFWWLRCNAPTNISSISVRTSLGIVDESRLARSPIELSIEWNHSFEFRQILIRPSFRYTPAFVEKRFRHPRFHDGNECSTERNLRAWPKFGQCPSPDCAATHRHNVNLGECLCPFGECMQQWRKGLSLRNSNTRESVASKASTVT